jgi:hypothetical protein
MTSRSESNIRMDIKEILGGGEDVDSVQLAQDEVKSRGLL